MEREEIIKRVSKALTTKKIHQAFYPIIKEFFIRAVQQYGWTEEELQKALDSFKHLQNIQFKNMRGLEKGRNKINFKNLNVSIGMAIEYLRGILTYDINKIEEFINVMIHELGHLIKIRKMSNDKIEVGLKVIDKRNSKNTQGDIINEFGEIICAQKLQKGNILEGRYQGYFHMQGTLRAAICALGLTEEELFYLQWQGRNAYEEAVIKKIGGQLGKTYLASFETILDSIHASYMSGNKEDVSIQVKVFNDLINRIFRERIQVLKGKVTIQYLAKLDAEQTMCNVALQDMLIELGIEEKVKVGVSYNLLESKAPTSMIERIREEGDRILEERDRKNKEEANFYDNTQLIEEIYESFSKYPIRLLPILSLPEIIRIKIASKSARIAKLEVSPENDVLTSMSEEPYIAKHRRFVKRMVNLARYNAGRLANSAVVPRQEKKECNREK